MHRHRLLGAGFSVALLFGCTADLEDTTGSRRTDDAGVPIEGDPEAERRYRDIVAAGGWGCSETLDVEETITDPTDFAVSPDVSECGPLATATPENNRTNMLAIVDAPLGDAAMPAGSAVTHVLRDCGGTSNLGITLNSERRAELLAGNYTRFAFRHYVRFSTNFPDHVFGAGGPHADHGGHSGSAGNGDRHYWQQLSWGARSLQDVAHGQAFQTGQPPTFWISGDMLNAATDKKIGVDAWLPECVTNPACCDVSAGTFIDDVVAKCTTSWCRIEHAAMSTTPLFKNSTDGFNLAGRIKVLNTGEIMEIYADKFANDNVDSTFGSIFNLLNGYRQPDDWPIDQCSYFSHLAAGAWTTSDNQWIGCSQAVEGAVLCPNDGDS